MGYRVHRDNDKFKVVQVTEGETKDIELGMTEDEAKKLSRHLNFGGGFDSWTPDFFTQRLSTSNQSV